MFKAKITISLIAIAALTLAIIGLASAQLAANQTINNNTNPNTYAPNTDFRGWIGNCFGFRHPTKAATTATLTATDNAWEAFH